MATQAQITAVQQLYVSYLGRAADKAGLDFWSNAIANGTSTIESVATGLTLANEYTTKYAGLSNDALVDAVYTNVLGRTADAAGKAFWVSAFANGTVKADTFVSSLIQSLGTQDQATINNKTFVAQTYTDTVGDAYTPAGGAAVIVGVTNDPATVTTAITAINNGTLAGQVPGLALINSVDAALTAQATFETENKAAVDALVATLAATKTAAGADQTTVTDGINASTSTFADKVAAAVADANAFRNTAGGGESDTSVLVTRAATADANLKTDFAALSATEKLAANTYVAAIAAEAAAKTGAATAVEQGAAIGGLSSDASATAGLAKLGTPAVPAGNDPVAEPGSPAVPATASQVYDRYISGTADQRAAIADALKDSTAFAAFKATADKDAAYYDAVKATLAAKDVLDSATATSTSTVSIHGVTVTGDADASAGTTASNKYVLDLATKTTADKLVADAQAADVNVAAAKALADAYSSKVDLVDAAKLALGNFGSANDGVTLHSLAVATNGAVTGNTGLSADKDVFYFGTTAQNNTVVGAEATSVKGALLGNSDFAIGTATGATHFGTGDSIVLGAGYTYNSGALSTGNSSAKEFFLVKGDAGVQIVVETAAFGSSTADVNATTGAITTVAGQTDNVAVITLTGVSIDHVAVNNGVVSYV